MVDISGYRHEHLNTGTVLLFIVNMHLLDTGETSSIGNPVERKIVKYVKSSEVMNKRTVPVFTRVQKNRPLVFWIPV